MQSIEYCLGYAVADGCLTESPAGTPRLLWLSTDEQIIRDIAKSLGTKPPVCQRSVRPTEKPVWRCGKADREFVKVFTDKGLVRRKTYDQRELFVEDFSEFLRGYTDGDGHIGIPNGRNVTVSWVTAAGEFSRWLQSKLLENGVGTTLQTHFYERQNWMSVTASGANGLRALRLCRYNQGGLQLERKAQKSC